jgi:hypothetical protein
MSAPGDLRDAGFQWHHICGPDTTAYDLARAVTTQLAERGRLGAISAIIYATCLPRNANVGSDGEWHRTKDVKYLMDFPASRLQSDFGLTGAVVIGLEQQACTAMLGSSRVANALLAAGPLLRLADDCDRGFRVLAGAFAAEEERHPAFISASVLNRLDYFTSFPHQATFPVALEDDEANLDTFRTGQPFDGERVRTTRLGPIGHVLTPAACYHVYVAHEGERLNAARYVTSSNTCFRRESSFKPLTRQWAFTMRELVCMGSAGEVRAFLARARTLASALCEHLGVPVTWELATDPFFQPHTNPKSLLQKVAPTKREAVLDGWLAIASVNLHYDHIASVCGITREGVPAFTGCLAFGLERWLYAIARVHGLAAEGWPSVTDAAIGVAGADS